MKFWLCATLGALTFLLARPAIRKTVEGERVFAEIGSAYRSRMLASQCPGADHAAPANVTETYRTDSANPQLPWYQLKPGEFPPRGSEHTVRGELIAADFIHRTGLFRDEAAGRLVTFALLPYGLVYYLNAEADLRDVPLGTHLQFHLYQDGNGNFTQAAAIQDEATKLDEHGLDKVTALDGKDADRSASEAQRSRHTAFLKQRGLAAIIDRVEGKQMVVTLLGDPDGLAALMKDQNVDPDQWARQHREVRAVVANVELRTYNPPVDNQGSTIISFQSLPTTTYGCGGVQWKIEPRLLLEGFRKGRIVRLFMPGWPIEDMPVGEGLYTERPGAKTEEESLNQYSYRTDFGNEQLPWYQLKVGEFPPFKSQHRVVGELLKVDADHRAGQFRTDLSGTRVDFTMPACGTIQYLGAEAELSALPLGRRYNFAMYQDEKGAFTRAVSVMDNFTELAAEAITCRVESIRLDKGKLFLADQLAAIKDDKEHLVQPPDLRHAEFGVDDATRVWKGDKQVALSEIAVGDQLLINLSGSTATSTSRCTDIWDGLDAQKLVTADRREKHKAFVQNNGMAGWIESVKGNAITVSFFAGRRSDFLDIKQGEPWGHGIAIQLLDDDLHPQNDSVLTMRLTANLPEHGTAGTYGSAGVRWVLENDHLPKQYQQGRAVRVCKSNPQ